MSDRAILVLQVTGFVIAMAFLPFMPGRSQVLFSLALGVHLVGDLLRLKKDHVI